MFSPGIFYSTLRTDHVSKMKEGLDNGGQNGLLMTDISTYLNIWPIDNRTRCI